MKQLPDFMKYDYECYMKMTIGELESIEAKLTGENNVYVYSRHTDIYFSAYSMEFITCQEFLEAVHETAEDKNETGYESITKRQFDKQFIETVIDTQMVEHKSQIFLLPSTEILNMRGKKKTNQEELRKEINYLLEEVEAENELINIKKSKRTFQQALDYFNQFKYIDEIMESYFNIEEESEKEMILKIEHACLKDKKWFMTSLRMLEDIYQITKKNLPPCVNGCYYINVPYAKTIKAKQRGAQWDAISYQYYFAERNEAWKFYQWISIKETVKEAI